jgi:hypothetical protein
MGDKLWKQTERSIARRLGGQRVGNRGRTGPDVLTPWACIEVKTRRRLPTWLKEAVHQAVAGAVGRLPLVVLHQAGTRHDQDLVVLRLQDFEDWYGPLDRGELGNASDALGEEHTLTGDKGETTMDARDRDPKDLVEELEASRQAQIARALAFAREWEKQKQAQIASIVASLEDEDGWRRALAERARAIEELKEARLAELKDRILILIRDETTEGTGG